MKTLKLVLTLSVMAFSGCGGYTTVKKDDIYKAIQKASDNLTIAQQQIAATACSQDAANLVNQVQAYLSLIQQQFK